MLRYPRRRFVRARRAVPPALLPLLLAAAASIAFFQAVSSRLKPQIETLAVSRTVSLISLAIAEEADRSLTEELLTYDDFISTQTDPDGQVTMLSFRTAESTRFRRLLTERMADRLESIDPDALAIPLGNLTGVVLFSALGPSVRVRVQSVGDVRTAYEQEFVAAGVNQTRHSVYLRVEVTVYLLIPGEIIPVTAQERVCVAETIIVGDVPDTYLNLKDGAN